jgi:CubicO group peptidase (beta-lactamase class C family)
VLDFALSLLDGTALPPASLAAILTRQSETRTVGWEARYPGWSGGDACSQDTIGHTGFTGTGLWIDFARGVAWSLLTNRVHPTRHRDTGIVGLRRSTGERVIAAFDGAL